MKFLKIFLSLFLLEQSYAFTPITNKHLSKTDLKQNNINKIPLENSPEINKLDNKKKIDIVFLTGSLVNKKKYKPLIKDLQKNLLYRHIESNIFLIDDFNKKEAINRLINNKNITENFHIIGHSFGGYEGTVYSQYNDKVLSLINWCSHYNIQEQLPYPKIMVESLNCPSLIILAELDEKLPCTDAIVDKYLLPTSHKMIVLDDFTHMSGIDNDIMRQSILSNLMSDYIAYIETNDSDCKFNIELKEELTKKKFKHYLNSIRSFEINKIGENIQKSLLDTSNKNIYTKNYSVGENMFETILQISSSQMEYLLYLFKFFPNFVKSHPNITNNNINISLFKPFKNSIQSYIKKNEITNSPMWLKLKKEENQKNIGKKIGETLVANILEKVDKIDREYYENRPIIFEDDIDMGNSPFCSLKWLLTPISIKYNEDNIIVRCPVLQTDNNIPEYIKKYFGDDIANSLNIKMLSETQILEWILVKCKM